MLHLNTTYLFEVRCISIHLITVNHAFMQQKMPADHSNDRRKTCRSPSLWWKVLYLAYEIQQGGWSLCQNCCPTSWDMLYHAVMIHYVYNNVYYIVQFIYFYTNIYIYIRTQNGWFGSLSWGWWVFLGCDLLHHRPWWLGPVFSH